jgi:hypothetical protein
MFGVWNSNMFLVLRSWSVDKSQQKTPRLFVSTDFGGVLKIYFGELKMRFLLTSNIFLVIAPNDLFCTPTNTNLSALRTTEYVCLQILNNQSVDRIIMKAS